MLAAIGALIAAGVKMWDTLTVSQEEHKQKLESSLKSMEELRGAYQKQAEETDKLFDRLLELNNIFPKTNSVIEEQKSIIEQLSDAYSSLQGELDNTGNDFDKLLSKMKVKNREDFHNATSSSKSIIDNIKKQISMGLENLDLDFLENLNNLGALQKQIRDSTDYTTNYMKHAHLIKGHVPGEKEFLRSTEANPNFHMGKAFNNYMLMITSSIWQLGRLKYKYDASLLNYKDIDSYHGAWKNSDITGKIQILEQLKNIYMKSEDGIKEIDTIIELYKKLQNEELKYQKLKKNGHKLDAQGNPLQNKLLQDITNVKQQIAAKKTQQEINEAMYIPEGLYNNSNNEEKAALLEIGVDALTKREYDLNRQFDKLKAHVEKQKKYLEEHAKLKDNPATKFMYSQLELDYEKNNLKLLNLGDSVETVTKQIDDLHLRMTELKQATGKYFEAKNKDLDNSIKMLDLQIKGDYEAVAIQKILNDLAEKKLKIDQKAIEQLKAKRRLEGSKKLQYDNFTTGQKIYEQMLRATGQELEAMTYSEMVRAEKLKGSKLSTLEEMDIRNLTELQYNLSKMSQPNALNVRGIQTNELAARGGFVSSVVSDKGRDINNQILAQNKNQNNLLKEIHNELKRMGVIQ